MIEIDVIIPCFNAGTFLEQSVQSALDQKGPFDSLNVIIVDDRSSDSVTLAALEKMRATDRVTVLSNSGAKGSAAARNLGIRHARGNWIAFLDADDWWPIDSIARRLAALEQFPDAEWIGGDFIELNRDGTWEASPRFERNLETYEFLAPAYIYPKRPIRLANTLDAFFKQIPTITTVTMARKSLLLQAGGFDEKLLRAQDNHLFIRLALICSFVFVPEVVAYYRLHETNSTRSRSHAQEWQIIGLLDLLTRTEFEFAHVTLTKHIFSLYISNSYEFRSQRRFFKAAVVALKAVRTRPKKLAGWRSFAAALIRR